MLLLNVSQFKYLLNAGSWIRYEWIKIVCINPTKGRWWQALAIKAEIMRVWLNEMRLYDPVNQKMNTQGSFKFVSLKL